MNPEKWLENLKDIEKLTRQKVEPLALPENFLKEAAKLPKPSVA